ncbi:hypothetical protein ACWD4Z_00290 [Streptomyces antibioticus]
MTPRASARRVLRTAVLASALSLAVPVLLAPPAHARPPSSLAPAEECAPDDQACKDEQENTEQAQKVEEQQQKTQEDAEKADQTIKDVGRRLEECRPGNSACMDQLAGPGMGEKQGVTDMTATVKGFEPGPAGEASAAVTATCSGFPGSLPAGSADPGRSPFPVSRLCALLGG